MSGEDLSDFSMFDLFRAEVDNQSKTLTAGLLSLEQDSRAVEQLEILMRGAHSLKGAARIVDLGAAVRVAHAMEDCFVAAQKEKVVLGQKQIDLLLGGVDLLVKISQTPESDAAGWENEQKGEIDLFIATLAEALEGPVEDASPETDLGPIPLEKRLGSEGNNAGQARVDHVLRVTADHLNRLLGLAGER